MYFYDPFPALGWVFVVGVVTVGYRPTGSSEVRGKPSRGTNPNTKTATKLKFKNLTSEVHVVEQPHHERRGLPRY